MPSWEEYRERGIPGRLEAARRGENPTIVTWLPSGYVGLGDSQFLPGYCVLLADPPVPSLEALDEGGQLAFLTDMARLGRAIQSVTGCARVNYGIYGNTDPYLHAHVWARYAWEPEERRQHPAWFYPSEQRFAPEVLFSPEKHGDLQARLRAELEEG